METKLFLQCQSIFQSLALFYYLVYHVQCSTESYRFVFHPDLQVAGCKTERHSGITHLDCARRCLVSKNCPSYIYLPGHCEICSDGYTITGLTFSSGPGIYLLRNVHRRGIKLNSTMEEYLNFSGNMVSGELLYLRAVLLGFGNWRINLAQNLDNIALHFRRRDDGTCPSPCLTMNNLKNGNWDTEIRMSDFVNDYSKPFELYILFQSHRASVFFNKQYVFNYTNVGDVMETGRFLAVTGDFYIEEIAL